MSTSCTSAALAATTSGSSSLARNTPAATCAASLYASIDLHSDDADLRSGEEISGEEDKPTIESRSSTVVLTQKQRLTCEMPMSVMSARRNKRKNFQPRNIRPSDSPESNEDDEEDNEKNREEDQHTVDEQQTGPAPVCCSISESPIRMMISSRLSDVDQTNALPLDQRSRNSSPSSSRSSSPNGSNNNSSSDSDGGTSAAVDLRLRPSAPAPALTSAPFSNQQDDDGHGQLSAGLEMKTWMLFWQQQQSCNDNTFKAVKLGKPPYLTHQQQQQQLQPNEPNDNQAGFKPDDAPVSTINQYAETTMRELLGIYGLERGLPVPGLYPSVGNPAAEGQPKNAESTGSLRTSSTPSGQQQPPTPPHTPKTSTAGQSATSSQARTDYSGLSEPSLMALQSHMHSLLNNSAKSSRQSSSKQRDDSPTADYRLVNQQASLLSCKTDLQADFNDVATTSNKANQQDLQQLASLGVMGDGRKPTSGSSGSAGSRNGGGSSGSGKSSAPIDYSRYVKRFGSATECGSPYCKDLNYREHFHCLDCHPRVFVKKEEMIRHFKWHKKRDESLQHGFMRYSPGDDCNDRYRGCPHNRKQTHYHCVKDGCDKVYISTSDVQMHANYHRKDSAIIQEGFQRFRATEDCATAHCAFNGQRTTHFHCRRAPCNYTFKNKADMEKHKSYHIKDEQLARDGFKKFMKNEACQFDSCRFSRVCNHIHCIREGCTYVLHSSGQLYSHKRKHERRDAELAYQDGASASNNNMAINTDSTGSSNQSTAPALPAGQEDGQQRGPMAFSSSDLSRLISDPSLTAFLYGRMPSLLNQLEMAHLQHRHRAEQEQRLLAAAAEARDHQFKHSASSASARSPSPVMSEEDAFRLCLARIEAGKPCQPDCQIYPLEHYHCRSDGCVLSFKSTDAAKEHWRNHEQQEQISDNYYVSVEIDEQPNPCPSGCPYQTRLRHYHCCWDGCTEIILATDKPFRRLDHYKMHEYSRRGHQTTSTPVASTPVSSSHSSSGGHSSKEITFTTGTPSSTSFSLDSMFRRKRGRPPKNRVIEVWNESSQMNSGSGHPDTPQAIFTSFKLPKPTTPPLVPYSTSSGSSGLHFPPPPYSASGLAGSSHPASSSSSRSNSSEWKSQRTLSPSPERTVRKSVVCTGQKRNVSPQSAAPPLPAAPSIPPIRSPDSPVKSITVVKAAGTFYPSSAFPSKSEGRLLPPPPPPPLPVTPTSISVISSSSPTPLTVQSSSMSGRSSSLSPSSSSSSTSPSPFTVSSPSSTTLPTSTTPIADKPVAYGPDQSCGRPFCKLKRREHYHCVVCNQAFSEMEKLKPHMLKHCTGALSPTLSQWTGSSGGVIRAGHTDPSATAAAAVAASGASPDRRTDASDSQEMDIKKEDLSRLALFNNSAGLGTSSLLHPDAGLCDLASRSSAALHALSFMSPLGGAYGLVPQGQQPNGNPSSFLPPGLQPIYAGSGLLMSSPIGSFGRPGSPGKSGNKRLTSSPIDHLMLSPEAKKMRFQSSMRLLKDEPVPDGYVRFRFNEDCQYPQCGYREHQTHFHCMRPDCGYSFCDKTRFVQHTARHERLDTLMGGDFQQYRANVGCGRSGCLYTASLGTVQNKASHFHCLKCDFVCTDTNKVVAHRRQHQKTDSILAAGFEKFTPSQNCRVDNCPHSNKQTHYHCLKCCYAVLGLAQMSAHKYRHLEQQSATS